MVLQALTSHRHGLMISTFLCCSVLLPTQVAGSEIPPPWDSGQGAVTTNANNAAASDIASWYQDRQRTLTAQKHNTDELQSIAAAGDAEAQYQLGLLLQSGRGSEQDLSTAQQMFEQAAQAGNVSAQYALALLLREHDEPASIQRSVQLQEQAALSGHPEAQYGLGMLYLNGQYVQRDLRIAGHWLEQAVQRGNQQAQFALQDLATQTLAVNSVTQQPQEIKPLAQPQAKPAAALSARPVASAQRQSTGRPVVPGKRYQQPVVAQPQVKPAVAEQPVQMVTVSPETTIGAMPAGKRDAAVPRQSETTPPAASVSVEPVNGPGIDQIRAAAEKGDMYAQLMLGAFYEDGKGVKQSAATALQWYMKAAVQGYDKAQHNLALLYEDGRGTEQDYRQAAIWYNKASQAGFSEAQNNLAVLYILGKGVDQDYNYAEQLLRHATSLGNKNAERNLDRLLKEKGKS